MNRTLSWIAGVALLAAASCAGAVTASDDAEKVVKETTEKVLEALRAEGDDLQDRPSRIYEIVDQLILPHFDFNYMSQLVLGRYWRQATPEQRQEFVDQFKALLVRTYSRALVTYRNQTVAFLPARERSPEEVTVRAEVDQGGGPKIPITYEMYRTDNGWKVYDVAIEGVRLVLNYRASFGQEIQRSGIDGLIKRLAEKNSGSQS